MSYTDITLQEIEEGEPITVGLLSHINTDLEDHESRLRALDARSNSVTTGSILVFAGSTAPDQYLLCDGSEVARLDYPGLFSIIGIAFGAGNGSTTFNLPQMARYILVGSGGTSSVVLNNTVGSSGGSESVSLSNTETQGHSHSDSLGTSDNLAAHTHTFTASSVSTDPGHTHDFPSNNSGYGFTGGSLALYSKTVGGTGTPLTTSSSGAHQHAFGVTSGTESNTHQHTFTTDSTGAGGAHNNVMPSLVLNFIIKT